MLRPIGLAAVTCTLALVAGCGSSGPGQAPLSASQVGRLSAHLEAVRVAADGNNRPAALAAIAALRSDVRVLGQKGRLSSAQAATLLRELEQARTRASIELPAPPPAAPAVAPATPPHAAAPSHPATRPATATPPPSAAPPRTPAAPATAPPAGTLPPGVAGHFDGKGRWHPSGGGDGGDKGHKGGGDHGGGGNGGD